MELATRVGCILAAGAAVACGPLGPLPGGALRGEVSAAPVQDWSFLDEHETVQLETRPDDPYSVNVWIAAYDGAPHVTTSLILGTEDPREREWVRNVLEDPRVRLRVGGVIYELSAVRVTDPAARDGARDALVRKYDVETEHGGRGDTAWIFRLDPR